MSLLITNNLDLWTSAILTKSTAGRGSNGKLEAYGIKKLRELILELAVRGKLVPQDPNDEPVTELLRKTISEKKRLVNENVLRDVKEPLYPNEPPDRDLPNGWVWTNLYEIGEIAPRNEAEDTEEASFVPMQLISEKYGVPVQHEMRVWKEIESGFTHFREEDVVLAKITPCFQNGKSAVMRGLTNGFGAGTTELHVYRSINSCTVPEYVLIYLKSPRFIGDGIPKMTGTAGQKRITRDYFAGNHFPLPPLAEQHRIVVKVDELMALCDQLEQQQTDSIEAHQTLVETLLGTLTNIATQEELSGAWTRIADHFDTLFTTEHSIDQLKQTILQLAVMGKLVPQDPNDEPASVLLKKVAEQKERLIRDGEIKRERLLPKIRDDELPFELPDSWSWARVWNVAKIITSGSRDWAKYYSEDGAIFVTMGNLSRGDYKLRMESIRFVRPPEDGEGSRTKLEENDLLISITGDVGNLGLIPKDFGEAYINQHTCLLRFMPECKSRYFPELMRSSWSKYQFDAPQRGVKNSFRLSDVGEMIIPVPPLREQHRIVVKVDELMALCDALKARLAQAQTTQIHLADAIVEQAVT
ncbi:MAG: restriction endonuclease subunit S [Nitrospiraceae bacterium]|nr:restriction endonuclease subunit S [Nitrospiraceae bacterium]